MDQIDIEISKYQRVKKFYFLKFIFNKLIVLLPVINLLSLILFIFTVYIVKYLIVLIKNDGSEVYVSEHYFLNYNYKYDNNKGMALLIIEIIFSTLFFISFFRTIFMDPGFFDDPIKMEVRHKISQEQINREIEKISIDRDFIEGPLSFQESTCLISNIQEIITNRNFETQKNELDISVNKQLGEFNIIEEIPYSKTVKYIFCSSCLRWKVERSHHCRQCGKCILKMDHHCPWLSNCIGFRNYKYFCLTIIYGLLSLLIIVSTFWQVVGDEITHNAPDIVSSTIIMICFLSGIGLLCFLTWLFCYNFGLVFSNQTVIEQSDRERFASCGSPNIYDLGAYRNFVHVFGKNPFVWFIPFYANYEGEGIFYEINPKYK